MNTNHMAIDIGAGSGRAFVGRIENGQLLMEELHRFQTGDMAWHGRHVRNLYRWYEEILEGLRKYAASYDAPLASIGVDTFGSDFVLLNRFGEMIRLTTAYRYAIAPQRALDFQNSRMSKEEIYSMCGNHTLKSDTLLQLIDMRLDETNPLNEAECLLFLADLFNYLLCGCKCSEASLASYAKLYNQDTRDWENRIFEAFDLPKRLQVPIVQSGDRLGKVYPDICSDTGLREQPYVIAAPGHDTAAAAFAVPDSEEGTFFISSGSWSLVGIPTEKAYLTPEACENNASNSIMPMETNMFKKNVTGMWILQRCQREWDGISFGEIVNQAKKVTDNKYYIDVDHDKLFNPASMSQAICDLAAEQGACVDPNDVGRVARICFESIALKYKGCVEMLGRLSGQKARRIYIVGGGSQNALLNQLTADACGVPVYAGLSEATVVGNLLMQMIGSGKISGAKEAKEIVKRSFSFEEYLPSGV